ncbi:MAG: prolyl-tRNA synthetase associated domain-containing protein [Lachnospiraceae bacterium]|nr:prolyl-tRNA synthetase associated domain-containing protein [Lachnospiraceae bacterium]
MNLYDIFEKLDIRYEQIEHPQVFTAEEAQGIKTKIDGVGCKNIFLTDKKEQYLLIIVKDDKKVKIKEIAQRANTSHLSFASEEKLKEILGLELGSVSPLGIIHDRNKKVKILIDAELQEKKMLFHPNRNTATLPIRYEDLIRFIEYEEHKYILI